MKQGGLAGWLFRNCAAVLALAIACAPAMAQHPWAMRNATSARTGQSTYPGATDGFLDWKFFIAGYANNFAVAQDGSIYPGNVFHQEQWSNEAFVYALTSTGELKWRVKVTPYVWGASQAIDGSPALDRFGDLVVPSTNTQLLKFTSGGDLLWTYQGNSGTGVNNSPAVLADDSIRHTLAGPGLLGLSGYGTFLLSESQGNYAGTVAVSPNGDMAIGGIRTIEPHGSLDIQYFNANGTLRWDRWSTWGAQGTPLFGPDGTLFAPFLAKAFNPDGSVKWTTSVYAGSAALSTTGVLYFPSGGLVAISAATGGVLWTAPISGIVGDPAIDSSGNVFVTTATGYVWSVRPTGAVNWSLKVCDSFHTSPVIGSRGNVIACGQQDYKFFIFSIK